MKTFIFFIFYISTVFGQQATINLQVGSTTPAYILEDENLSILRKSWYPGINMNLGYSMTFSNDFLVSTYVDYNLFFFKGYSEEGGIPEIRFVRADGENSHLFRTGVNFTYSPKSNSLPQGYVFTGLGYVIESFGKISMIKEYLSIGQYQTSLSLNEKNYFVHLLGLGVRIIDFNLLKLAVELKYFTNYNDRFFFSGNLSFSYEL